MPSDRGDVHKCPCPDEGELWNGKTSAKPLEPKLDMRVNVTKPFYRKRPDIESLAKAKLSKT